MSTDCLYHNTTNTTEYSDRCPDMRKSRVARMLDAESVLKLDLGCFFFIHLVNLGLEHRVVSQASSSAFSRLTTVFQVYRYLPTYRHTW